MFEDWNPNSIFCYFYPDEPFNGSLVKSWKEARDWCSNAGGHLVSEHSQAERDFIADYLLNVLETLNHIWIGLRGPDDKGNIDPTR